MGHLQSKDLFDLFFLNRAGGKTPSTREGSKPEGPRHPKVAWSTRARPVAHRRVLILWRRRQTKSLALRPLTTMENP